MTFTDAELDQLTKMLVQTDPSRIGYSGPKAYNRDGRAAAAAITYLRAQLSERDPIGAAIMRQACVKIAGSWGYQTNDHYVESRMDAVEAIRAIPLPTHAETLAYALQLPEIKALVDAKPREQFPILGGQGAKIDWQLVADHGQQAQQNHGQTVARLAERGGLSWCELFAVLHNKRWQKMDTNEAMIACRALEAKYLAALEPKP